MNHTLLGKKLGMSQVFDERNRSVPVTVVQAGPCSVVQVRTPEKDGYHAVQIGYETRKEKRATKALAGHAAKAGVPAPRLLREVRCDEAPDLKPGDSLDVTGFQAGQKVDVVGATKGRGFQGVVKRFKVKGGPASHGSMFHRRIGAVGLCQNPGRVFKNQKMPGRMGGRRRTAQNLEVVKVLPDQNLIFLKGGIPGANGDTVLVRAAVKGRNTANAS